MLVGMTVRWGEGQGMVMRDLMDGTLDVLLVPLDLQVNESLSISHFSNILINFAYNILTVCYITRHGCLRVRFSRRIV